MCPVDITKIDRYFISGCLKDKTHKNLLEIVVDDVKQHGSQVLAEGVETKQEYDFLRYLHVDYMQGFYLGMPV